MIVHDVQLYEQHLCQLPLRSAYALDSSRSVAEVQSHLDHFTRGTGRAERSH